MVKAKSGCMCKQCQCEREKVNIVASKIIEHIEDKRLPFTEKKVKDSIVRVFYAEEPEHLFKWHWDEEDRLVEILSGEGWKFQFDNEIPTQIKRGDRIAIERGVYHRLIPGKTDLEIIIKKY